MSFCVGPPGPSLVQIGIIRGLAAPAEDMPAHPGLKSNTVCWYSANLLQIEQLIISARPSAKLSLPTLLTAENSSQRCPLGLNRRIFGGIWRNPDKTHGTACAVPLIVCSIAQPSVQLWLSLCDSTLRATSATTITPSCIATNIARANNRPSVKP
jgi:hypothetical protein